MRWLRLTAILLFFSLLAVRFPPALTARGLTPFWLFLPALLFGFVSRPGTAALAGWCCGALAGLLSIEPFGVAAFLYAAAAWLISNVRGSFFSDHALTQGVTAFVMALLVGFVELLRIEIATPALAFWSGFSTLLLMAILTGFAFPALWTAERRVGLLKASGRATSVFERRLRTLMILGGLYLLLIALKLVHMQIFQAERWKLEAAELGHRVVRMTARRGAILERQGVPLAEDRIRMNLNLRLDRKDDGSWICRGCGKPLHTEYERPPRRCGSCRGVEFDPGETADWSKLPGLLGLTSAEFAERGRAAGQRYDLAVKAEMNRRKKIWKRARLSDVEKVLLPREWLFFEGAPEAAVKEVVLHPDRYWGVVVRPVRQRTAVEHPSVRRYLGKLGKVTQEEGKQLHEEEKLPWPEIWRMRVGRSGLEEKLEDRLGSREGRKVVERDRRGEVREVLAERSARDGQDVRITLDFELQQKLYDTLVETCVNAEADGGAFVAIDPATGEILAMVGYSAEEDDPWDPAITSIVPGSVFKVVTAIAALESGGVDPDNTLFCDGAKWNGIGCSHVHGDTDLVTGLSESCNKYFAWVATLMGVELWSQWGKKLGFGTPTGIEITREMGGLVPDAAWKQRAARANPEYWDTEEFTSADLRQVGFGRGAVLVSALQVARFMAIIANGGRFVTPSLVVGEGKVSEVVLDRSLPLIRQGLESVVTTGTAHGTGLRRHRVAGKTGTAELIPRKKLHHSWFAGYAPAESPRVAFACLIRTTPRVGAVAASPVILAFLDEVLGK